MPEVITLHDATTGATAKVSPSRGFNCFSYQSVAAGKSREVLWSAADFAMGEGRPSGSGIPLLFPFPGRLRGTTFEFAGKKYTLETGDAFGNAIHGFVYNRPWRVVDQTATRVAGEFQASLDDPLILDRWPADFRIAVVYELLGHALACDVRIENPCDRVLPFGFGTHPYFRVPIGGDGRADDCVVSVPVSKYWELIDMLPSGRRLATEGGRSLESGMRFGDAKLDDVFTDLRYEAECAEATIDNPSNGRRLTISFDEQFSQCVVYTPPHCEAICIEPYTCVPDSFALSAVGVDTGLRLLEPGQSFATRIEIRLT